MHINIPQSVFGALLLGLVTAGCTHSYQKRTNNPNKPQRVRELWRCDYDKPVESTSETGIAGISYYTVYDKKNLNEDPVSTETFLMTEDGAFDPGDAASALRYINFVPSRSTALPAAELLIRSKYSYFEITEHTITGKDRDYTVHATIQWWMSPPYFGEAPEEAILRITLQPSRFEIEQIK